MIADSRNLGEWPAGRWPTGEVPSDIASQLPDRLIGRSKAESRESSVSSHASFSPQAPRRSQEPIPLPRRSTDP